MKKRHGWEIEQFFLVGIMFVCGLGTILLAQSNAASCAGGPLAQTFCAQVIHSWPGTLLGVAETVAAAVFGVLTWILAGVRKARPQE